MRRAADALVRGFPLWALLAAGAALASPGPLAAQGAAVPWLLGLVMLGMGATLGPGDFRAVTRRPRAVAIGTALQFGLMPALAWALGRALDLPVELATGMLLVGAAPGGTASNVICFLARGDVALSISLTLVSTLLSVLLTPTLVWLYAGAAVPVPVGGMLLSVAQVVIVPVALGVGLRTLAGPRLRPVEPLFPLLSVLAIAWIIAIVVALNADRIASVGVLIVAAVALHNALGLAGGYGLARLLGLDAVRARTVAIEVGMQNSGLAVTLGVQHFSSATALPGAVFSVWHNLSGSLLAAWWGRGTGPGARSSRAPAPP